MHDAYPDILPSILLGTLLQSGDCPSGDRPPRRARSPTAEEWRVERSAATPRRGFRLFTSHQDYCKGNHAMRHASERTRCGVRAGAAPFKGELGTLRNSFEAETRAPGDPGPCSARTEPPIELLPSAECHRLGRTAEPSGLWVGLGPAPRAPAVVSDSAPMCPCPVAACPRAP